MPSESVETVESGTVAYAQPRRPFRVFLNRLIFRGTIFTIGVVALVMFRVIPNKNTTWRFIKARARRLARHCGVRVQVRGREHVGSGPYVFTPNHQSHFDIVALLGHLPGNNRFAAKKELFKEPILGAVLRTMGSISVDRTDSEASIARLKRLKDDQFSVIIFPEGTRNSGPLLPFKKGAFVAAIDLGIPVVPVVCKNTDAVMPKGGYLSIYPGEVEMVILEPIPTSGMTYEDRDRLLELVRDRINAELGRAEPHPA
jgi:1-acyl-sn-glycerol-3-phosphate acyltransferase